MIHCISETHACNLKLSLMTLILTWDALFLPLTVPAATSPVSSWLSSRVKREEKKNEKIHPSNFA